MFAGASPGRGQMVRRGQYRSNSFSQPEPGSQQAAPNISCCRPGNNYASGVLQAARLTPAELSYCLTLLQPSETRSCAHFQIDCSLPKVLILSKILSTAPWCLLVPRGPSASYRDAVQQNLAQLSHDLQSRSLLVSTLQDGGVGMDVQLLKRPAVFKSSMGTWLEDELYRAPSPLQRAKDASMSLPAQRSL